jgi:hypothetical protein
MCCISFAETEESLKNSSFDKMPMPLRIAFLAGLMLFSLTGMTQGIRKTMNRLPDTGQISGYTITFGEDNDYTFHPPGFIDHGDGTLTDTVTGLMWQKSDGGEMTWENAVQYCKQLALAGHIDWRLPDAHESFSILNHQYVNPSLDVNFFTASAAEYWWSGERQYNDTSKVWVTNAGGGIGNHPRTETISAGGTKRFHVRAVRDAAPPRFVSSQFTDNANGTVTDHLSGLIWQQMPYGDTVTWENALLYADTCTVGGYADWRVPNIREMQSLNDESIGNPSISIAHFPGVGKNKFWSSTTLPNQPSRAWYLDTRFGITTYQQKTVRLKVLAVRGDGNIPTAMSSVSCMSNQPFAVSTFSSHIKLMDAASGATYELADMHGRIHYEGKQIDIQDFSSLPTGLYVLMRHGNRPDRMRLCKER